MRESGLILHWIELGSNMAVKTSFGRRLEQHHPNRLDIYMISWFLFQLIVIIALIFTPLDIAKNAIIVLLAYRLFEIGITNFDSVFVRVMQHRAHISVPRLFSLIFINYIEIILSFGVIFHIHVYSHNGHRGAL